MSAIIAVEQFLSLTVEELIRAFPHIFVVIDHSVKMNTIKDNLNKINLAYNPNTKSIAESAIAEYNAAVLAALDAFRNALPNNMKRPYNPSEYYKLTLARNKKDGLKCCQKIIMVYKSITNSYRSMRQCETAVKAFDKFFNASLPSQLVENLGKMNEVSNPDSILTECSKGFNANKYAEVYRSAPSSARGTIPSSTISKSVEYVTMVTRNEFIAMCRAWAATNKINIIYASEDVASLLYAPTKFNCDQNSLRNVIKISRDIDGDVIQENRSYSLSPPCHLIVGTYDPDTGSLKYKIV